ncbi:MAG: phenylalanine--tRNA ligase subunit alpha [Nitrososphaerota archaeon]|nr:phenylalanine--tRNA ligase subunit alpha [Candidatus Bathyarchaeota archaeon]MDW8062217.1 phenylalanine--tRNA ligase subunit alpha [Nitrososphaerota archaeon]
MDRVSISRSERRVLETLGSQGSPIYIDMLASLTDIPVSQVASLIEDLRSKGLVECVREGYLSIEVTDEGELYRRLGLPERRSIRRLLEVGAIPVAKLAEEVGLTDMEAKIAGMWLIRRGWAEVEEVDGVKILKPRVESEPEPTPDEKLLGDIGFEGLIPIEASRDIMEALSILERRKLIEKDVKHRVSVRLTDYGLKVVRGEVEVLEEVTRVTGDLIATGRWRNIVFKPYDVTLPVYQLYPGRRHFLRQVLDYMRRIWVEMGFKEMEGPIVETAFWDFDALYVPQDHPARDMQDTFYLRNPCLGDLPDRSLVERVKAAHEYGGGTGSRGWRYVWSGEDARRCLLRTHTTCLSARTIAKLKSCDLPAKFFSIGRVFRNETLSWKSLCEFYQTDGIVVDEKATFAHLLGYLKRYFTMLGFRDIRFRPAYFPYTEPSVEIEVYHPVYGQWLELGGAGVFRPEVVEPLLGMDIPVLAWGPGLNRIVMMNYGINDIRELHANDLRQLRELPDWIGV